MIFAVLIVLLTILYLALYFRKSPEPNAKPPRATRPVDNEICRAAVHEAGHATLAWSCTAVHSIDRVRINDTTDSYITYQKYGAAAVTAEGLWCSLVIGLAGLAAEANAYGRMSGHTSKGDLAKSRSIAKTIASKNAAASPWPDLSHPSTLPFDRMFTEPLSEIEASILATGYAMARRGIEAHGANYYRVVSMLLTHRSVGEADLEKVLGPRAKLRFAGIFAKSMFVFPKH